MCNLALTLTTIQNEPRVRDVDLAVNLGMARPTNIRRFIESHRDELESFGTVHAVSAPFATGNGTVKNTTEFHLNRNQALLTCILSRTEKGREIRAALPSGLRPAIFGLARVERGADARASYQRNTEAC